MGQRGGSSASHSASVLEGKGLLAAGGAGHGHSQP